MSSCALVTGATGFVGTHLVERLTSAGWRVRALVRNPDRAGALRDLGVETIRGDLDDLGALRDGADGADCVLHLAGATTAPDEAAFLRANATGTANVARAVREAGSPPARVVYLSSYAACGPSGAEPRRIDETPRPLTAYGRSKLAGEPPVAALSEVGVVPVVVRAPAVYGPGDRAFLPYFRLVKRGVAPSPSGPERRVHLVFVHDLADALLRATGAAAGTYPVAEPVEHRWTDVVREIGDAVGRRPRTVPLPPRLVRWAGAAAETFGDLLGGAGVFNREKAEELLASAWVCDLSGTEGLLSAATATPLRDGIRTTAQWYRTNGWI